MRMTLTVKNITANFTSLFKFTLSILRKISSFKNIKCFVTQSQECYKLRLAGISASTHFKTEIFLINVHVSSITFDTVLQR